MPRDNGVKLLEDTIKEMITRMDSSIISRMYQTNQKKMPALPTQELQNTFKSIVGDKKNEKQKQQNV